MALFDLKIATAEVIAVCSPAPIVPNATALQVIVSKQDAMYTHSGTGGFRSSALGLPYIPGASLPVGSKWLIYYQLSAGSSNSTAMVKASFVAGTGASTYDIGEGWFECTGHGIPEVMNGAHMAGFFPYTGEGKILEFVLTSTQASPLVYYGGIEIIAIRMDTPGAVMTLGSINGDYNGVFDKTAPFITSTNTTYQTLCSCPYTASTAEDFFIWASVEANPALNEAGKCRVMIDGVQSLGEWRKQAADTRDIHTFTYINKVQLTPGAHTITIEGAKYSGVNPCIFRLPKIVVLKLSSFGSYDFHRQVLPAIGSNYPGWTQAIGRSYSSPNSGEYALVMGQGMIYRSAIDAASICRVINNTTGQSLSEFTSVSNATSDDTDRTTLVSAGAELIGPGTNNYSFDVTGEAGYPSNPVVGSGAWAPVMFILGLSKIGAPSPPANVLLSGSDSVTPSESPTLFGQAAGVFSGQDTCQVADTCRLITSTPVNIPLVHPRLWIYNNDRLTYWQAQYAGNTALWQNLLNGISQNKAHPWLEAIAYLASGNTTYRDACFAKVDSSMDNPNVTSLFQSQGLQVDDSVRAFAMIYDWLYSELGATRKQKMQDYMLSLVYWTLNNNTPFATSIYAGQDPWAVGNPFQNFNSGHILQACYAALALYGEQPATTGWPAGSTTNRTQFIIPSHTGPEQYTDLYAFLIDALEGNCLPQWERCADGGAWHEGANYGNSAMRRQIEICHLLDKVSGSQYLVNYPYLRERCLFSLYEQQPGRSARMNFGDGGGSQQFPVDDVVRMGMLMMGDAFRGTAEGSYVQWWLRNESTYTLGTEGGWDMWLLREDNAGINYTSILPLFYYSPGVGIVNSRSDWTNTGISVTFNCGRIKQNHTHSDQNGVQIYKGPGAGVDGWLLTDSQPFGGSDLRNASQHNTYNTASCQDHQRFDLADFNSDDWDGVVPVQGKIDRIYGSSPLYSYAQGNCADAYYTLSSSGWPCDHRIAKINEIFLREWVHIRPGYVVLFDRFRLASAFAGEEVNSNFNFGRTKPIEGPPGTYTLDNSASASPARRLFWRPDGPPNAAVPVFTDYVTPDAWRARIVMQMADGRNGTMLNMFHVTTAATAQMVATEQTAENPTYGFGSYRGITIKDSTYYHVLFSSQQDGSTPGTAKVYDVNKQNNTDIHLVFNLTPGIRYLVTETAQPSMGPTYYRYDLAVSSISGFVANSGGVVQFTPADLPNQGSVPIENTDTIATVNILETGTLTVAKTIQSTTEQIGTTESGQLILAGGTPVTLSGIESITPVDSIGTGFNLNDTEYIGLVDSGSLIAESAYAELVHYTEKTISSGGPDLIPSADLGSSFAIPEPNDGVFFNKLSENDDNTFVRIPYPLPAFVIFSDVAVALANSYVYQGTIRSIRFKVRIRTSNTVGSSNPYLSMRLFRNVVGGIIAQYPIPMVSTTEVIELQSPTIQVQIPGNQVSELCLGFQLRATTYAYDLRAEVSRAWVEITSDSTEKVIG